MQEKVLNKQSLLDVSVHRLGSVVAIFDLCERNGLSITDEMQAGELLAMPEQADKKTVELFERDGHRPATAITEEEIDLITGDGEGVEFWYVECDFVAS